MRRFKRVEVNWEDASLYSERHDLNWTMHKTKLIPMKTVGFLIKRGRKVIIVSAELNEWNKELSSTTVIPRSSVTSIRYLEEKDGR